MNKIKRFTILVLLLCIFTVSIGTSSTTVSAATYGSANIPYRFVTQEVNLPIQHKQVNGSQAYYVYAGMADKAISIAVGLTKSYIWIPYTVLGIQPSELFAGSRNDPSQYIGTYVYVHKSAMVLEMYDKINGSWIPVATTVKATIEDTTTAYVLKNSSQNLYTSKTSKRTETRTTPHYGNKDYMLQIGYDRLTHGTPSWVEDI